MSEPWTLLDVLMVTAAVGGAGAVMVWIKNCLNLGCFIDDGRR